MAPCWWWLHLQQDRYCSSIELTHSSWMPHGPRPQTEMGYYNTNTNMQIKFWQDIFLSAAFLHPADIDKHEHPAGYLLSRLINSETKWCQILLPVVRCGAWLGRGYRLEGHGRGQVTCGNNNTFRVVVNDTYFCEKLWAWFFSPPPDMMPS